jgi:glycosyltransferase involved in cell wall biosynthesis
MSSAASPARPLRIASVCRTLPTPDDPSAGVFVLNRLAAMARQADVHAVQPQPYFPMVRPLPRWARAATRTVGELSVEMAPMFYLPKVMKSLDAMWLRRSVRGPLVREHRRRPFDLVDAHFGYPEGAACVELARQLGVPAFITVRGFENEYLEIPGVREPLEQALRTADGCICVSHSLAELIQRHGVPPERVRVVHNAIEREVFRPGDRGEARARLGLPVDVPLVVSVGHLVSRKRHHVLIEAFAQMRREFPTAQLAIIGAVAFEPAYPDQLKRLAVDLGVAEAVRLVGNRPQAEVVEWLNAADLFALGTAREGCCNAVLEALAMGLPMVTTPAGDNAHFVKDGENGYLVPVDDADAMAAALGKALQRRDWDRLKISRSLAVGSWDDVARDVVTFFRERLAA